MAQIQDIPTGGVPEIESCPGWLLWSAFGAWYPDSVCSSVLTWENPADHPGSGYLCDADDDLRCKDVPCPFCLPESFTEYEWGGGYVVPTCATCEAMLPPGTPIDYHDGPALTFTATCPTDGRSNVLMRDYEELLPEAEIPDWFATAN